MDGKTSHLNYTQTSSCSLITLITLLKGRVTLDICMKAPFFFILGQLALKDKWNKGRPISVCLRLQSA